MCNFMINSTYRDFLVDKLLSLIIGAAFSETAWETATHFADGTVVTVVFSMMLNA